MYLLAQVLIFLFILCHTNLSVIKRVADLMPRWLMKLVLSKTSWQKEASAIGQLLVVKTSHQTYFVVSRSVEYLSPKNHIYLDSVIRYIILFKVIIFVICTFFLLFRYNLTTVGKKIFFHLII